ncbi:MAG: hypothetical protein IAF94_18420 [Pirellulaceae bacterium]|nr:hypothetical protein [Pirellulaceae bacterium]
MESVDKESVYELFFPLSDLLESGRALENIKCAADYRNNGPTNEDRKIARAEVAARMPLDRWPAILYQAAVWAEKHRATREAALKAIPKFPSRLMDSPNVPAKERPTVQLTKAVLLFQPFDDFGDLGYSIPSDWESNLKVIADFATDLQAILGSGVLKPVAKSAADETPKTSAASIDQRRREGAGITRDGLIVLNALCLHHQHDEQGVAHADSIGVRPLAREINKTIQDGQKVNEGSVSRGFRELFRPNGWETYVATCAGGTAKLTYALAKLRGEDYSHHSQDAKAEH